MEFQIFRKPFYTKSLYILCKKLKTKNRHALVVYYTEKQI